MRLGSVLMIAGIVLFIAGLGMSTGNYHNEYVPDGYGGTSLQPVYEPNPFKPIFLGLGGFLFSAGAGGWIGTFDAERRRRPGA